MIFFLINIYTDILKKDPGYTNAFKKIRDLLKNQNKFYTSTSERNRILNISGDATSSQTNN